MDEMLNGNSKDEVHQKLDVEEDGSKAQLDDETLRMGGVVAEESFEVAVIENEEKGLASSSSSSSSSDEDEAEVVVTEKTDETGLTNTGLYEDENGVLNLTVDEEAVGMEPNPVTEELRVVEVIEEDISEFVEETAAEVKGYVEEESEVIITEESQMVEAVVVELAGMESESAEEVLSTEYADQEGIDGTLRYKKEEDSFPDNVKSSNGTDDSHKEEPPETIGNPQIISISARTMQPTSWRGCCGLLDVFKRGNR